MVSSRFARLVSLAVVLSLVSINANPIPVDPPERQNWGPAAIIVAMTVAVTGVVLYLIHKQKSPKQRMTAEKINLSVTSEGGVLVTAMYHLEGIDPAEGTGTIFYPLPNSTDSLLSVSGENTEVRVHPLRSWNGRYQGYYIDLDPGVSRSSSLSVTYLQKPGSNQCRYILRTTKQWKNPVGQADFTIALPYGKNLARCSYAYQEKISPSGTTEYAIHCRELWPSKDLEFVWE